MRVLVDTTVWSLALRHRGPVEREVSEFRELVRELRVELIGAVRQELLSGVPSPHEFRSLRDYLRGFPDFAVTTEDYERAAEFYNICRARGIQGSGTDFLLCAVAQRHEMTLFTTDRDFVLYARHLPVRLHAQRPPAI